MAFYLITESFLLQTLAAVISLLEEEERSSCISLYVRYVQLGERRGTVLSRTLPALYNLSYPHPFIPFLIMQSRFTVEFFILISNIRLLSAL